jgi:hypothetical protein
MDRNPVEITTDWHISAGQTVPVGATVIIMDIGEEEGRLWDELAGLAEAAE